MSQKPPLLLLHGALGSGAQLDPLAKRLEEHFTVYAYTFSGHGGKGSEEQPFSIQRFAQELAGWLQEQALPPLPVFGYSMGGYVALWLSALAPQHFTHILTLGTKFNWSPEGATQEVKRLQPEVIEAKVPQFAQALAQRHAPHSWKRVMENTAEMMLQLGKDPLLGAEQLKTIGVPVTIMLGSEDRMVSQDESKQAAAALPNARFLLLQGQPHPIEQVDEEQLLEQIRAALQADSTQLL